VRVPVRVRVGVTVGVGGRVRVGVRVTVGVRVGVDVGGGVPTTMAPIHVPQRDSGVALGVALGTGAAAYSPITQKRPSTGSTAMPL
jgi:hypothetical protein